MDFERYTDRAKGFLQSAQTMALRRGHQRLTPEHLLKVLLEDSEGLCAHLIRAAGGEAADLFIDGGGHGFTEAQLEMAYRAVFDFLTRHGM